MKTELHLRTRIPVEPLDDDRLTRIERTIVMRAAELPAAPMRARGRGGLTFAIATCAVAAAALIGWRLRGAIGSGGDGGGAGGAAGEPAPIVFATHAQQRSVELGDARIEVGDDTAFAVTRPDGGVLVALAHGRVELEVAKRHGRPPLIVRANDTDVIVVGTHFSVDAGDGHGDVDVRVTEGVVRVVRHQTEVRVAAGQEWRATTGVVAAIEPGPVTASSDGLRGANGSNDASTIASGDVKIAVGRAPDVLHGRTAAVPVVPPTTNVAAIGGGAAHASSGTSDHASVTPRPAAPSADGITLAKQTDIGIKDPVAAIAAYQKIAVEHGDPGSTALYSMAVTQLNCQRCGGKDEALRTIEIYLRRFQSAPERPDALSLRVSILCGRTIDAACRQAAASYLRENPDGKNALRATRITQTE